MQNKKVIIVILVVALIFLVGGGFFALSSKKEAAKPIVSEQQQPVEEKVNTLTPHDIGLTLTATPDNKKVSMQIAKVEDISSLDYELSYTAKGNIPRGVIGHIDNKTKGKPIKQEIVLGTCSDVCHYDQEVSGIKVIVKVTKLDNKVYSVEKSLEL